MGRMWIPLTVQGKKRGTFGALIDTGASVTVLSHAYASLIGIAGKAEHKLEIGGFRYSVCYRRVDLHIPRTDCFVEKLRVAVIATPSNDIPGAIIGADFLQRSGAFIDMRKGRHAIGGDIDRRDPTPAPLVRARPVRLDDPDRSPFVDPGRSPLGAGKADKAPRRVRARPRRRTR